MLLDIIKNRVSPVIFDKKELTKEQITTLLEAARWAPSCYNEQPWRFFVIKGDTDIRQKVMNTLFGTNPIMVANAPLLLVTVAKRKLDMTGEVNAYSWHDVGLAMGQLGLQATSMGLVLHQMGGFDHARVKDILKLDENSDVISVTAIGYKGQEADIHESLLAKAAKPRSRRALDEIVTYL